MKHSTRPLAMIVAALLAGSIALSPATAQTDPAPDDPAAPPDQLGEIHQALLRIGDLLEKQLEDQRLDLLLKRVEHSERQIGPLEAALRTARSNYESEAETKKQMQAELEMMDQRVASGDVEIRDVDMMTKHFAMQTELVDARLERLATRISELEERSYRMRLEVEDWQAYLDRALSNL